MATIDRNDIAAAAGVLLVAGGAWLAAGPGGLLVVVGLVLLAMGTYGAGRAPR